MRIQTNQFEPLALERSIDLPEWLRSRSLAEATRLAVVHAPQGPLVKLALLMLEVRSAQQRWQSAHHPLFDFMFRTEHVEIDVSSTR